MLSDESSLYREIPIMWYVTLADESCFRRRWFTCLCACLSVGLTDSLSVTLLKTHKAGFDASLGIDWKPY